MRKLNILLLLAGFLFGCSDSTPKEVSPAKHTTRGAIINNDQKVQPTSVTEGVPAIVSKIHSADDSSMGNALFICQGEATLRIHWVNPTRRQLYVGTEYHFIQDEFQAVYSLDTIDYDMRYPK